MSGQREEVNEVSYSWIHRSHTRLVHCSTLYRDTLKSELDVPESLLLALELLCSPGLFLHIRNTQHHGISLL